MIDLFLVLLLMNAVAEEPQVEGVDGASSEAVELEVIVWGEPVIRQARSALARALRDKGWRRAGRDRLGRVVFRPPEAWMGRARLTDEGSLLFGRPVVAVQGFKASSTEPREAGAFDRDPASPASVRPALFLLPSQKRLAAAHAAVLVEVAAELQTLQEAIQQTNELRGREEWVARLDAVWDTGAPLLAQESPLETFGQRRRALLRHWAGRAETPEGIAVCVSMEFWFQEVVMASDHPFQQEELRSAEKAALHGRLLTSLRVSRVR